MRCPGKARVVRIVACETFKHEQHPQVLWELFFPQLPHTASLSLVLILLLLFLVYLKCLYFNICYVT